MRWLTQPRYFTIGSDQTKQNADSKIVLVVFTGDDVIELGVGQQTGDAGQVFEVLGAVGSLEEHRKLLGGEGWQDRLAAGRAVREGRSRRQELKTTKMKNKSLERGYFSCPRRTVALLTIGKKLKLTLKKQNSKCENRGWTPVRRLEATFYV